MRARNRHRARANSSVGRAPPLQGGCRGVEPLFAHQTWKESASDACPRTKKNSPKKNGQATLALIRARNRRAMLALVRKGMVRREWASDACPRTKRNGTKKNGQAK